MLKVGTEVKDKQKIILSPIGVRECLIIGFVTMWLY